MMKNIKTDEKKFILLIEKRDVNNLIGNLQNQKGKTRERKTNLPD